MSKINIGIIGAGNIAEKHLDILMKINEVNLLKIYSRTSSKARKLAKKYSINVLCKNLKEFMTNDLDGILILVSAEEIFNITKKLLPYKIPLFIEKPLALTYSDYIKIYNKNKKYKTPNMIGFNRRFYSNFHKVLKIIKNDNDKINAINIEGHERSWLINKSNIKNKWFFANSVHTVDLLNFFGGKINSAKIFSKKNKNLSKNYYTGIFKFQNGIIGSYNSYWSSPGSWRVSLFTAKYSIIFSPLEHTIIVDRNFKKRNILLSKNDRNFKTGFYDQIKVFINLIKTKKLSWPGLSIESSYDTFKTLKLLQN